MADQFNTDELREQLSVALQRIEELPFAHFLSESRVTEYLKNIQINNENAIWHVDRLLGFGASESGSLVADIRNRKRQPGDEYIASFKSARDVVGEKLMYKIPETNDAMKRGKRLEPFVAESHIKQLIEAGHTVKRDTESLQILRASSGAHREYPWLRGKNIDDILIIDGKRIITDYKVPSQEAFASVVNERGGLGYQCQMNQYDLYAKDKGVHFDGQALVIFDLYSATTQSIFLSPDYDLQREIIMAGEHYWNDFVMRGRLPNIATQYDRVYEPEDIPSDVYEKAAQYVALKTLKDRVSELAQEQKLQLEDMFARNQVSGTVAFELGGVTATSKQVLTLNAVALEEEAERLGIPLSKYEVKGKVSYKRLYNKIEKLAEKDDSIYLGQLASIEQSSSVRQAGKSKAGYALYQAVASEADEALKPAVRQLTQSQMSVLSIIKEQGAEQKAKIEKFQSLQTALRLEAPLDLSVEDLLIDSKRIENATYEKGIHKNDGKESTSELSGNPEEGLPVDVQQGEQYQGTSVLDDDFVVEFDLNDIAPSMSR